jgi:MFS family permease
MRKKVVLWTSSQILTGFSPNVPTFLVGLVSIGLGSGAYFPVDGAVMIDAMPG